MAASAPPKNTIVQSVQAAVTEVRHAPKPVTQSGNSKILLAVTSATAQMPDHKTGYFWAELLHPYEAFTTAGFDVDVVSETGSASVDESSIGAMANGGDKKKWEDKAFPLHAKLAAIRPAAQVNAEQYNAVYFAGGHAACIDFPHASALQQIAARIYESGGTVGADCHGIAIFDNLKLSNGSNILQGRKATGFSPKAEESMKLMEWMRQHNLKTMREVIEGAGGQWHEHSSNPMSEYIINDERIVTGMNPASAVAVAKEMLKLQPPAPLDGRKHHIIAN